MSARNVVYAIIKPTSLTHAVASYDRLGFNCTQA